MRIRMLGLTILVTMLAIIGRTHAQTSSVNVAYLGDFPVVNVVVYQDGGGWTAHALELKLYSNGATRQAAVGAMEVQMQDLVDMAGPAEAMGDIFRDPGHPYDLDWQKVSQDVRAYKLQPSGPGNYTVVYLGVNPVVNIAVFPDPQGGFDPETGEPTPWNAHAMGLYADYVFSYSETQSGVVADMESQLAVRAQAAGYDGLGSLYQMESCGPEGCWDPDWYAVGTSVRAYEFRR